MSSKPGTLSGHTKLGQATETSQGNGGHFRTLVENLPVGVYRNTPGPQGKFLMVNPAFIGMFGFDSEQELLEANVAELYANPAEREAFSENLLAQGRVAGVELCYKRKDGAFFWGSVTAQVVRDKGGKVAYFDGIVEDITQRKQAEDLVRGQHALALKLGAAAGLDETLRLCVEAAISYTEMDAGGVYLVDEACGDLHLAFSQGLSPGFVEATSHYAADSPSARLVIAGKPIYMNYLELGVPLDDVRRREGLRVIAILPVHHRGKVIACMNITSHTLDEISATARHTLETIAAQVGNFVARARAESQRDATLEALRESEARFRSLIHTAPSVILCLSPEGQILEFNPEAERLYGRERDEVLGQNYLELFLPQELREPVLKDLKKALAGEPSRGYENPVKAADGSERILTWNVDRLLDNQGRPMGVIAVGQDITERVRMEKELRKRETHQALVLRSLPMAFYTAKPFGDYGGTWVSEQIYQISGYTAEQFVADTHLWAARLHPKDRKRVIDRFDRLLDGGAVETEYRWQTADGTYLWLLDYAVLIRDDNSEPKEIVGTWLDITERKRAEKELEGYREHLEALVKERTRELEETQAELLRQERLSTLGQLTATIAHEIRNPLGTIRTAIFTIGDAIERDQMARIGRALRVAERNIVRCDRIISELLDYALDRILEPKLTPIDTWLEALLNRQHIPQDIVCTRALRCGAETMVDREHLRRAVVNVINNALDALQDEAAPGKRLTVSTHVVQGQAGSRLEIRIGDTGPGIPSDVLDQIFEPLFSTKTFGIGMGLPIVKNVMERHHGGVEVQSVQGQGTTVVLWLPI